MRIRIVGSAVDGDGPQFAASYIVNDRIAIDAGCIGFLKSVDEQRRIRHVLLSHSHMDHIATLPMFLDSTYQPGVECVTVHAHPATIESLRKDVFNDRLWPDLIRLSAESPFVKLESLRPGQTRTFDDLRITALELQHVVPTLGFVIQDGRATVGIVSDLVGLGPIRSLLTELPRLDAVFLECSFPNRLEWLADCAQHLTPARFAREAATLSASTQLIAIHVKASFREEILAELHDLALSNLQIGTGNSVYTFPPS